MQSLDTVIIKEGSSDLGEVLTEKFSQNREKKQNILTLNQALNYLYFLQTDDFNEDNFPTKVKDQFKVYDRDMTEQTG